MPKKDNALSDLFLREKPVKILLGLRANGNKSYASTMAKFADCTYSHTVKILEALKKAGVIAFEKKGRIKYIALTELGSGIAKDLDDLSQKFLKVK